MTGGAPAHAGEVPAPRLVELFGIVGPWFLILSFIGRMPVAMNVVGVLTFVTIERDSLAEAGIVSAAVGVGAALGGPIIGWLADRFGQRPVLIVAAIGNAIALLAIVVGVYAGNPIQLVLPVCVAAGLTVPQVGPMTRARWLAILAPHPRRAEAVEAAFGYESTVDEIGFVAGPVLAGAAAVAIGPAWPVLGSAALTVAAVIGFALHRTALPPAMRTAEHAGPRLVELARAAIALPAFGMLGMGAFFGSTLSVLTAFMRDRDVEAQTGLVYGAMGVTAAVAAISVVRIPDRFRPVLRWVAFGGLLAAAGLLLPGVGEVWMFAAVSAVLGVGVGVVLVTLYWFAGEAAPPGLLSTTMTIMATGVILGQALTVAGIGALADAAGYPVAAVAVPAAGAAVTLFGVIASVTIARRRD